MRNGASDTLYQTPNLEAEAIFDLYEQQYHQECLPFDGDTELEKNFHRGISLVEKARALYGAGGVDALLNSEDENLVAFGEAVESGNASHLAI